jgi:hypothetical protein
VTPFSTPELLVLDTVRLVITGLGFLVVGFYLRTRWPTTKDRYERARALGCALAMFILAVSRAANLGNPGLAWQMIASALVFALVGYSALRTTVRKGRG